MEHQQLEEAVAAFALGALDEPSRIETERALLEHLPGCASCRELFNELREVAADLAIAPEPRAVPRAVEERILEGIREQRHRAERPPAARRSPFGRVAVVAAAAAIVALFAWNLQLASHVNDERARSGQIERALSLVGASDARSATLTGPQGTLVFVYRPGEAVLVGHDVAQPPSGRVLQLWLMRAGVPTSAGVFRSADGLVFLSIPIDPRGLDRVAVTVEKGPGGATKPTGDAVYSATLA